MRYNSAALDAFTEVMKVTNQLYNEISSSPDTLRASLDLYSGTLIPASESMILGLFDLSWSSRFFQPERNILNHLVTVLWSTAPFLFRSTSGFGRFRCVMAEFKLVKAYSRKRICCTFIYTAFHGVKQCTTCQHTTDHDSTFSKRVPTTAWTASVTWYTRRKLAHG